MNEIHLLRRRLLWRTRGLRWDYLFLLRPEEPELPGWLQVFEQVFTEDRAPAEGVLQLRGRLRLGASGKPYSFVAAALRDPERVDGAGRSVQQFFIYLLEPGQGPDSFSETWAHDLLAALSTAQDAIFEEQREEEEEDPLAFSERLLRTLLTNIPAQIPLPVGAGTALFQELPDIELSAWPVEDEKKVHGPGPTQPGPFPYWVVGLLLLLLVLLRMACPGQRRTGQEDSVHGSGGSSIRATTSVQIPASIRTWY